jgi:hypothetical protein
MFGRFAASSVVGVIAATPILAVAQSLTAAELLPMLALKTEKSIAYRETRHSSLLKRPLVQSGELRYRPPDTLEKQVIEPPGDTYRIEAQHMTVVGRDGRTSPRIALSGQPALAGTTDSLRAMMRGDLSALERMFRVELLGDRTHWLLSLLPRDPKLGKVLNAIQMRGSGADWQSVELLEASGDRVTIEFVAASSTEPGSATAPDSAKR